VCEEEGFVSSIASIAYDQPNKQSTSYSYPQLPTWPMQPNADLCPTIKNSHQPQGLIL